MTPGRRTLRYDSMDDIMPDVERLLGGHATVGNWSLSQICRHLATVMRRVVDLPASTSHDPSSRADEATKARVFETGLLPEGIPTPAELAPSEVLGDRPEAEGLRDAIAYYKASASGPLAPHRVFGPLSKDQWDRLQCIHCAHHLSFASPTSDRSA